MRARKVAGRPTLSSAKSATGAKTSTMPDIAAPSRSRSPARNMMRPCPNDRGDSVATTPTMAVLPCRAMIGWCRASCARIAIARPNAVPITATAATPADPSRIPRPAHHRLAIAAAAVHPATAAATTHGDQRIPAAVTNQLAIAAGTRRIST